MITVTSKGDFNKIDKFLDKVTKGKFIDYKLNLYGQRGVSALNALTPRDTGLTAASWYYEIERKDGSVGIHWKNSNVNDGVNIAIILQYGHGTKNGGYVNGVDYINPALRPVFYDLAKDIWKEVTEV